MMLLSLASWISTQLPTKYGEGDFFPVRNQITLGSWAGLPQNEVTLSQSMLSKWIRSLYEASKWENRTDFLTL